jgi:DNA-binding FrmR family transcriptional regulator
MAEPVRSLSVASREDVNRRLRRIEGQVRGIQRMVDEGRDCREIITQVTAIRSALNSVNSVVVQCYAHTCLESGETPGDRTIAELIALFKDAGK